MPYIPEINLKLKKSTIMIRKEQIMLLRELATNNELVEKKW